MVPGPVIDPVEVYIVRIVPIGWAFAIDGAIDNIVPVKLPGTAANAIDMIFNMKTERIKFSDTDFIWGVILTRRLEKHDASQCRIFYNGLVGQFGRSGMLPIAMFSACHVAIAIPAIGHGKLRFVGIAIDFVVAAVALVGCPGKIEIGHYAEIGFGDGFGADIGHGPDPHQKIIIKIAWER